MIKSILIRLLIEVKGNMRNKENMTSIKKKRS